MDRLVYNLRYQVRSHASFTATIREVFMPVSTSKGLERPKHLHIAEGTCLSIRQTKNVACCSFLGPLEKMPFHGDIIHLLIVLTVALFFGILSNKAGMLFTEHPDCPRTSMLPCVLQSAMNSARIVDNLTDLSTIRILLSQVSF
jgi:hypothetical protein